MGTLCSDPVRVFYEEHSSNTVTGALSQEARQGGSNAPVKVLFLPSMQGHRQAWGDLLLLNFS